MKIKLAILEKDRIYLTRIVSFLGIKYPEELEIYSFTDPDVALATLNSAKINILLANEEFLIDTDKLPKSCAFAYLVESKNNEIFRDQPAVFKFQRIDLIYKQILDICAEKMMEDSNIPGMHDKSKIVAFCSASGGAGASTVAAACAIYHAKKNRKVLYLNLETFGGADVFFSGQGFSDMSDVVFALKSKKTNLTMKLESCVKRDQSGVYFYSQPKVALDMMELSKEEIERLLLKLKSTDEYDYIILDTDFGIDEEKLDIYRKVHALVLVGDDSVHSCRKTERAYAALVAREQNSFVPLTDRVSFMYNKLNGKPQVAMDIPGLKVIGAAPACVGAGVQQTLNLLSSMEIFDKIL